MRACCCSRSLSLALPAWAVVTRTAPARSPSRAGARSVASGDRRAVRPTRVRHSRRLAADVCARGRQQMAPACAVAAAAVYAAGVLVMLMLFAIERRTHPPARRAKAMDVQDARVDTPAERVRRQDGRPSCGAAAPKPRAQHADGVRHPPSDDRDSRHRRHVGGRQAARRGPSRAGARRAVRLPDADAGVCGVRAVLVPSRRVVGGAAAAHRARAGLRRSRRSRRAAAAARVCGPPARDRLCLRQSPRAGAGRQHGATRVSSKGACSRRSMPRATARVPACALALHRGGADSRLAASRLRARRRR